MRHISKLSKLIFFIGLFAVGLFFIISGIIGIKQANNWPETTGTIKSITMTYEATNSEDNDEYEVLVSYTVDGKSYTSDLGVRKNDFEVGKQISILYNPEAPEAIVLPGTAGSIIGIIVGVVAMLGSAFMFILTLIRGY